MVKIIEHEEYLDTRELMQELTASRKLFYSSIKPNLKDYHFDGKKKPWYKKRDAIALKTGKPVRKASIAISGMFGSWTAYAQTEYGAETELRSIETTTLPNEAIERFQLSSETQFIKRSRLTRVGRTVICTWDTYYPLDLVSEIKDSMINGTAHVVEYLKEKHGLIVERNKDVYSARLPSLDEQNLFHLVGNDPMLILQRASYTDDKKTLVLYTDMVLLGNWFVHEHEYAVNVWNNKSA